MSEETILQIPCELTGSATKSVTKTTKLVFETQETVPPELIARITAQMGRVGWLSFLVGERQIDTLEVVGLPEIKTPKDKKSKAERQRNAYYVLWQKQGGTGDFDSFYDSQMERGIDDIKSRIRELEV